MTCSTRGSAASRVYPGCILHWALVQPRGCAIAAPWVLRLWYAGRFARAGMRHSFVCAAGIGHSAITSLRW